MHIFLKRQRIELLLEFDQKSLITTHATMASAHARAGHEDEANVYATLSAHYALQLHPELREKGR